MIQKHKFNEEESLRVYKECESFVEPKECYTNTYYIAVHFAEKFHDKKWKVAYGYIRLHSESNLWARHAFIVNEAGEAIDATFFSHVNHFPAEEKEHTSFHVYNDITKYADDIRRNKNMPDLSKILQNKEIAMQEWAKENGMILVG